MKNIAENLSSRAIGGNVVLQFADFLQSNSIRANWKGRKQDELASLAQECLDDNCDLDEISVLRAKEFIATLPFEIELPTLSIEEGGNALVEWYRKPSDGQPTILSIVFGRGNYIFSLFLMVRRIHMGH